MTTSALLPPEPPVTPPAPPGPVGRARPAPPQRRCVRHEAREAVARCVACEGGFCRECITEHAGKLYCGPCFTAKVVAEKRRSAAKSVDWSRWRGTALTAGSLVCLGLFFYWLGRILAAIPAKFHDGTIWKETLGL